MNKDMNKHKKKSHIPSIVNIKTQEKEIELYWMQPWISYEGSKVKNKFTTTMERGF